MRAFLAKLSKKGNYGPPSKSRNFWLITEKLVLRYFLVLLLFLLHFSFFIYFVSLFFFVFFLRVKGQVRWPEGPPHLKPS